MRVKFVCSLAISFALATSAIASDIFNDDVLSTQNPKLDRMITGANHNPVRAADLPPGEPSNLECPLCFHRDLLKKTPKRQYG